jgi:bacillithiol biosynthesis cysteine-adding enzyme BshC
MVVLIADSADLKKQMISVFEDDIFNNSPSQIVESTAKKLTALDHRPQAKPRPINLFYLKDGLRERIELNGSVYQVVNTNITFSKEELLKELKAHPERISPNVILRGIFQEKILPNIAFIGGGGEIAYWLELKSLFEKYEIPFPVLVLRNSYMIVEKKWKELIAKLGFVVEDFFATKENLLKRIVDKHSKNALQLNGTVSEAEQMYLQIRQQAAAIDSTLENHVDALRKKTVHHLKELEKKMIRAEKRKYSDQLRQIETIKKHLFPGNGLQERFDNILYYYASYGPSFIECLKKNALSLEQEFVIIN